MVDRLLYPRKDGELTAHSRDNGAKFVGAPKGAPISMIYRGGYHYLMLAATHSTHEQLGLALLWQHHHVTNVNQ